MTLPRGFLRMSVILKALQARTMQECDSKGVTGILILGGGLGLWRGWVCRALGVALTWGW